MKKTKIVATLGPSSTNQKVLTEMIHSGLNVARINFSHGTLKSNQDTIDLIKSVRDKLNIPLAIMVDTRGPEVRVKSFEGGSVVLKKGKLFTLHSKNELGTELGVAITEPSILNRLQPGNIILANDGLIVIKVI